MISKKKRWKKTNPIANRSLPTRPFANRINRRQIEINKRPFDGQMKGIKMGYASRMKRERRANSSTHTAVSGGEHSKLSSNAKKKQGGKAKASDHKSSAQLFDQFKGDKLIVIDGNGVVQGEQDIRRMYWEHVNSSLIERGAACLPEMAELGELLNQSIFDVKIPLVDLATGQQYDDDILTAVFLMDCVGGFQWLLSRALLMECDAALLLDVFRFIVVNVPRFELESPKIVMAKMMGRFMAELFHSHGLLNQAIADSNSSMGQPFARQIATDFLAELAVVKEHAALDALIPDLSRTADLNPLAVETGNAVFAPMRAGGKSLRI